MTASQTARLAGFNASLQKRGVILKLDADPNNLTFQALINEQGASELPGEIDDNPLDFSEVAILKDSVGLTAIVHGSLLVDEEGGRYFRVLRSQPFDIKIVFRCEKE